MQNFAAIGSALLEKMTFEVAIFGNFPDIPEPKLLDVTLGSGTSCRVTVLVLFVSVKPEAWSSFG